MKSISIIALLLLKMTLSICQPNSEKYKRKILEETNIDQVDIKSEITKYNLAEIFTKTQNSSILGFIGENYQRIRIKIISVIQNQLKPDQYLIYGKSLVKNNICEFQGFFQITEVHANKVSSFPDLKTGKIIGQYQLFENPNQKFTGVFKGVFNCDYYFDTKEGNIKYDDLMRDADGFYNNQFVGTWTNYSGTSVKVCNWGDYQVPDCADLGGNDGAFFYINRKYISNGWESYGSYDDPKTQEALKLEKQEWWK